MKRALGLFHFNLLYVAGDKSSYHRYCTEAIIPFLRTTAENKWFKPTFEITGVGLDFLARHYPAALDLLRELVVSRQVELISSTYYPTAWIVFPLRDLIESIDLNRQCLARLEFPAAPIFFSQECFFGRGLSQIDDRFSVALCKDDYLLPQLPGLDRAPVYRMDGIKVVVGSNHLANRLAGRCDSGEADAEKRRPDATVADGNRRVSPAYAGFETGTLKGLEWKWYHFGSGHHLTVPSPPTDPERFYFDAHWTASNLSYLVSLRDAGYTFSSISDFVAHIADSDLKPLPFVVEGGWNIRRSKGVFQWMGGASIPWQDSPSILAMASRSRERLLACEAMAREMGLPASSGYARRARELWAKQIMAECSDPHGWLPTQGEVRFGRSAAEDVLREASRLLAELSLAHKGGPQDSPALPYGAAIDLDLGIALIGQGETVLRRVSKKLHLLETRVMPQGGVAGVVFRRDTTDVTYCCSGMESQPTTFRLRDIAMPDVYLPLANGLISLGENRFLIRVNTYGVTAAKLSREDNTVTFQAATAVRPLRQRFLVYEGASEGAVTLANSINAAGDTQSLPARRDRVVSSISDVSKELAAI